MTVILDQTTDIDHCVSFLNAFGVFQSYYQTHLASVTPSDISWIGSVQAFFMFFMTLPSGIVIDRYGPQPLYGFAMLVFSFSCMMTSLTHSYWQVMLAQGVLQGLALGCAFVPSMAAVVMWFQRPQDMPKRTIGIGIATCGSGTGGVVWPIIVRALMSNVGFGWTWRALGFSEYNYSVALGDLAAVVLTCFCLVAHAFFSIPRPVLHFVLYRDYPVPSWNIFAAAALGTPSQGEEIHSVRGRVQDKVLRGKCHASCLHLATGHV